MACLSNALSTVRGLIFLAFSYAWTTCIAKESKFFCTEESHSQPNTLKGMWRGSSGILRCPTLTVEGNSPSENMSGCFLHSIDPLAVSQQVRMTGIPRFERPRSAFRRYSLSDRRESSSPGDEDMLFKRKSRATTIAPPSAAMVARSARYFRFVGIIPDKGGDQNVESSISITTTRSARGALKWK